MQKIMFFSVLLLLGCNYKFDVEQNYIKRVALVIGNQNYVENKLANPINDAQGVKEVLESIGFKVILGLDLTHYQFNEVLKVLKSEIEPHKTLVFIYFAGHGNTLQRNSSEQFLMMTDREKPVIVSIFKLYTLLESAKSRYNIIALDACRDYQRYYTTTEEDKNFRGNFRKIRFSEGNGTEIEVVRDDKNYSENLPKSTIISFATQRNQTAKDWSIYDINHSPYSYALINHLDDEEIPIEELFKRIQRELDIETDGRQVNSIESTLFRNIWLVPKRAEVAVAPAL